MNDMAQINRDSWGLAAIAVIKNGPKIEAYSTSQIRKIMSAVNSSDDLTQIRKIVFDYTPAPPQNVQANQAQGILRKKRETNKEFGDYLFGSVKDHDFQYAQNLLKYTLWNIKIIEQNLNGRIDKLPLILECENVENKDNILNQLKSISNSDQGPRKSYGNDNRHQAGGNYRRRV
ncbi:MAG: hypothetical protein Q7J10_10885 [Methanosarcinaceae archaeon]|nr:hypothetical protein [Methanosarcinaceae archaeon]